MPREELPPQSPSLTQLRRARALWEGLAGAPVTFAPQDAADVAVSPKSSLCPAGWVWWRWADR
ncbi:hypothetical protein ACFW9D_16960 [Streptomyces sp. NPDC059524]|uniref:hypothetical protein n=1 Tax=Streptomyces sp. NPDC059524 TaxID=3346856 RepID=UPI0036CD08C6